MHIARQKRRENIAEYILYLWQLEDLLRALQLSPDAVWTQLVAPRQGLDEAQRQELFLWYMELVNLLREEGREASGHLAHTLHLVADLQNLHLQLMELPVGREYRALWAALSPEIPRLRALLDRDALSEMEICFRTLYAAMLYRMRGDERKAATIGDVLQLVSPVVAALADIYRRAERGELDLFKGEK